MPHLLCKASGCLSPLARQRLLNLRQKRCRRPTGDNKDSLRGAAFHQGSQVVSQQLHLIDSNGSDLPLADITTCKFAVPLVGHKEIEVVKDQNTWL
jgi:hypothetical protein